VAKNNIELIIILWNQPKLLVPVFLKANKCYSKSIFIYAYAMGTKYIVVV